MKKLYRRSISGLMALLICFTTILGGGITAFAASSSGEVAKSYSIGFPRSGDANLDYSGTWGHDELHYMNGWTSGEATWMTTLHTIGSFDGPACYCIEPGVPRLLEKTYTRYGEDYWKNYPSDYNSTIDADTIKTLLGRIMQYGYTISEVSNSASSMYVLPADKKATVKLGSTTIVEMHNVLRDTPKTGDTTNLPLLYALAGLSAVGIAVCGVVGFKKKKKEDRN